MFITTLRLAISVAVICALPILGNAQIFGKQNLYPPKFQVGINTSVYSFFEGIPIIQNVHDDPYSFLVKTAGFEVIYFINRQNGLRFTYNPVEIYYYVDILNPKRIGTVDYRNFKLLNIEYLKPIFISKYIHVSAFAGLTYRKGNESYIIGYGALDLFVEPKNLNDLGLSIGTIITIPVVGGLNVNTSLKYTGFVYRENTGGSIYYDDNGSSQQMFSISVGIGYAFRIKKKKKGFTE